MARKFKFIVFSKPVEGMEEEYNDWYQNTHLREVCEVPGFVSAQRYKLSMDLAEDSGAHPYVALYDIEGNTLSLDDLAVQGTDYDYDTSSLKNTTAIYAVKYQEMNLGDMNVTLEKTGADFASSSVITGMIAMKEEMTFGGDFEPKSYNFSMAAGPQNMTSQLSFADGKATGRVEGGKDGGKDVDVELVQGAILKNAVDLLISTLPLAAGASFKFPVLDAQSGGMENLSIEVTGEEDVMVPAGSYSTFKVRVKSGDGEQIMYVQKTAPHWLVKQENPAQGLNIELKSIKM